MHALDLWLLNKLDALTTKLQRKGYRLTEFYVYVVGTVLISVLLSLSMAKAQSWLFVLCGVIWGGWLWAAIRWANANKDYPESHKLMEKLNARALRERERDVTFRIIYSSMLTFFAVADVVLFIGGQYGLVQTLISILSELAPILMFYLHGCFYIGPGHFAKERQERESRDMVRDNG
jgi:hypothetical protein